MKLYMNIIVYIILALIVMIKCKTSYDLDEDDYISDEKEDLPGKDVLQHVNFEENSSFYLKFRKGKRPI